mmetsp:Transcript_27252/g.57303  ORF Transcript_27252/g.57303 Transcript_27252/m.57303 type:complete len:163 (-) Transcript_27252:592-1080(-)
MAGYELGKSVEVLHMESWTSAGANMTQRIMRLLHLSTRDYKWRKTNNFQPIYSVHTERDHASVPTVGLEGTERVSTSQIITDSVLGQCCQLFSVTGVMPPWLGCKDVSSCLDLRMPIKSSTRISLLDRTHFKSFKKVEVKFKQVRPEHSDSLSVNMKAFPLH